MARKQKQEECPAGAPAWMATFSDLMNLLLCFFVLLFSMSSTDTAKYNEIVEAITSTFSIFSGGGSALDQGILVSSGVSQLNELAEYYSNLGVEKTSDEDGTKGGSGEDGSGKNDNSEKPEVTPEEKQEEKKEEKKTEKESTETLEEYQKELKKKAEENYDKLSKAIEEFKLNNFVDINMDSTYNYIGINIDGYFLFDSGSADLKKGAENILSKAAALLSRFEGFDIGIEGHTDNVPQTNTRRYKNNLWLSSARAVTVLEYLTGAEKMDPSKLSATGKGEYEPIASNDTAEGRQKNRRVEIKIYNKIGE